LGINSELARFRRAKPVLERPHGALRLRRFWRSPGVLAVLATAWAWTMGSVSSSDAAARPVALAHPHATHDALHEADLLAARSTDPTGQSPWNAVDGRAETAWAGRPGETRWQLTFRFARPTHMGLLRTHWGQSPTSGVPTIFRWEVRRPGIDGATCAPSTANVEESWALLEGARQSGPLGGLPAQPTHRSWFVDARACGLRLVVERTNAAPPVVWEVQAVESASNVLEDGLASDDGAYSGFSARLAIDGAYGTRWVGAAGKSRWMLRVDLPNPETIDRVRLVLGFDSTSVPRPAGGRTYAMAWAPIHYVLQTSEDGRRFEPIAYEPVRADRTLVPLRRRLVTLPEPRRVRAVRLIMMGATGSDGVAEPDAVPVVREFAAFRADDKRPILAAPWILSVNANPSAQSHSTREGEMANDAYYAKFLHDRFGALLPTVQADDRFARSLGPRGEWTDASRSADAGAAIESIEGDDPALDAQLLAESSPPPVVVLSGSNDWDYAVDTGPDRTFPMHWHWDPLRDARFGGMGQLAEAVQRRVAPFLGFCGGAQILALLEARRPGSSALEDLGTLDRVLQRTSAHRIRGWAPSIDVERAWPTDPQGMRTNIRFAADDTLFADLAGPFRRSMTRALPEWHVDAIRPDAFLHGGPLDHFDILATSAFCAPDVVPKDRRDGVFPGPDGGTWCATVPEVFRSRDRAWPIIGAQFHAEQRDFANAAPGDPPESVADARLFLAAAYEAIVDSYESFSP
jgi:hypothetical protein